MGSLVKAVDTKALHGPVAVRDQPGHAGLSRSDHVAVHYPGPHWRIRVAHALEARTGL